MRRYLVAPSPASAVPLEVSGGGGAPLGGRLEGLEERQEAEEGGPPRRHRPLGTGPRRAQLPALGLHAVRHEGVLPHQVRAHLGGGGDADIQVSTLSQDMDIS